MDSDRAQELPPELNLRRVVHSVYRRHVELRQLPTRSPPSLWAGRRSRNGKRLKNRAARPGRKKSIPFANLCKALQQVQLIRNASRPIWAIRNQHDWRSSARCRPVNGLDRLRRTASPTRALQAALAFRAPTPRDDEQASPRRHQRRLDLHALHRREAIRARPVGRPHHKNLATLCRRGSHSSEFGK